MLLHHESDGTAAIFIVQGLALGNTPADAYTMK